MIIDGKEVARKIRFELKSVIETAKLRGIRSPGLAVILVGDDPASSVYVRNKEKACSEIGIISFSWHLPSSTSQKELIELIKRCNVNSDIDGILLQLPLPKHFNTHECLLAIDPSKDVDGFHPENVGRLSLGLPGLVSCTPSGVIELLKRYKLSPSGKKAVVVGRSDIVGKPLAMLLSKADEYANATVTLCHSKTHNLEKECKSADFLFLAIGKPKFITENMVNDGAVVIDIGINRTENGICGDADFDAIVNKVHAITPVPGGVGPMTIAMLLKNTVQSWQS